MKQYYRISIICGLFPLAFGVLIFFVWKINRFDWLEMWLHIAGIINLFLGLLLFFIGIVALINYFIKARSDNIEGYKKKSIIALVILVINFPVAAKILGTVDDIMTTSTVTVVNQSKCKMEHIYLLHRASQYEFGSVSVNERLKRKLRFESEASAYYEFICNGIKYEGDLFEYVSNYDAPSAEIIFTESNKVVINKINITNHSISPAKNTGWAPRPY